VLLHPTSLQGPGIGDLGDSATRFIEWLHAAGQGHWQILPLVPVDEGGSPYNGLAALAGNPLLVSPDILVQEGLLGPEDTREGVNFPEDRVEYPAVLPWKEGLLREAYHRFTEGAAPGLRSGFDRFRRENAAWLSDYALFRALRAYHDDIPWVEWPAEVRDREEAAIEEWRARLAGEVAEHEFQQYLFHRQWESLRERAHEHGLRIIGDLPIFVAHDSADVWAHPEIFRLDDQGRPTHVSGVPPDYFSESGQRWGNPLYRWDVLRERRYDWWVRRFERTLQMVDLVRVDHFRGFSAFWEIPADEPTAVNGRWVRGPGIEFFREIERQLGKLPIIAEDLGLITPDVEELREELDVPGMRVIQFAFDGDPRNTHLPSNYDETSVAYTGTHDNDTLKGWWAAAEEGERDQARKCVGSANPDVWDFVRAVFASPADLAIVPLQDLLGLSSDARMNTPGRAADNWTWRIGRTEPDIALAERLRSLTEQTGRLHPSLDMGPR